MMPASPLCLSSSHPSSHKQQERQAEKAKASEPRPLTETQLAWHKLQQERAQLEHQQQQQHQPIIALQQQQEVAAAAARPSATPVYTITWQVRLTSLSNIPLPWAAN